MTEFDDLQVAGGSFTVEEVSLHNKEGDCWHPGGKVILGFAGCDATYPFSMAHKSALSAATLKKYKIGTLVDYKPSSFAQGIRTLTDEYKKKGYFDCSKSFLFFQFFQMTLMNCLAYWIFWNVPGTMGTLMAGFLHTMARGQGAWFMHDLGHFSIFRSTQMNRIVQYLVMNVYLGASFRYWRNAHWKHHFFTNIEGWDHDIDTLPLFAWTKNMFAKMPRFIPGQFQEYYWYFIGPATSFYYIHLLSFIFYMRRSDRNLELTGNVLHHLIIYFLVGQSIVATIGTYFFVMGFLGLYMGHIFSLNHFPMEILDKTNKQAPSSTEIRKMMENDLIIHQLRTTRNVTSSWFVDWFTGHLNFQIEHHVWPMMPRHNYHKVQPALSQLCKEYGVAYQEVGFFEAFQDVFRTLTTAHSSDTSVVVTSDG